MLDLGCGDGRIAWQIKKNWTGEIILTDIQKTVKVKLPFVWWDGKILPFPNQNFDIVLLSFILHYCHRPEQVLKEGKRVVKKKILVLEDCPQNIWEKVILRLANWYAHRRHWQSRPKWFFGAGEWEKIFKNAHLRLVKRIDFKIGFWRHSLFVLEKN